MKTKISSILTFAVLVLLGSSCSEKWEPALASTGQLSMSSMGVNVNTSTTVVARSGIDLSEYQVKVVPADGSTPTMYTYGTMPEIITLPIGKYHVDVVSHTVAKAEWDKPLYSGSSKEFEIKNNEITEIGVVTCNFASLKVTVAYTDELKAIMGSDVTVTVIANNEGTLVFTPDETRSGYFEVIEGSMTMVATFAGSVGGIATEEQVIFSDVKAGQHYMITFSVKDAPNPPEQTGDINPGGIDVSGDVDLVDMDGNVSPGEEDTEDPGERPGTEHPDTPDNPDNPDNPDTPDNPEQAAATFSSATLDLEGVNNAATWVEGTPAVVNISCPKGITHLLVEINSEGLTPEVLESVGLSSTFDLAYPGALEEGISGLGFPYGDGVIGKTSVDFDITSFVPLLTIYPGASNFIITVTDSEGAQSKLTLKFTS